MEAVAKLYVWSAIATVVVIALSILLAEMIRSYYAREFAINRGFNTSICVCGIFVASWMASLALPVLNIVEARSAEEAFRVILFAGPIIAMICIGTAWLVGYLLVNEINVSFKITLNRRSRRFQAWD